MRRARGGRYREHYAVDEESDMKGRTTTKDSAQTIESASEARLPIQALFLLNRIKLPGYLYIDETIDQVGIRAQAEYPIFSGWVLNCIENRSPT